MRIKFLFAAIVVCLLFTGCASLPESDKKIVSTSASMIQPTQEKLSNYTDYKLLPLKTSEVIDADTGKHEQAMELEKRLSTSIQALLSEWERVGSSSNRTLAIEPELVSLRIISGSTRFFAGAYAGYSHVELKLTIKDADANAITGSPVISARSNVGAFSTGVPDAHLVDHIIEITEQYLRNNY